MEKFSLLEAQAKRSKALHHGSMKDSFILDAMIYLHLGLYDVALGSLTMAIKEGE